MKKIEAFDALRGLACLIVLLAHWAATVPALHMYASGCGKIGVWCFMLLSGFFLLGPWLYSSRPFSLMQYYRRKALRIYPAYLLSLCLSWACAFLDRRELLPHILALQGKGHFWYMPVILKLYLLFPLVLLLRRLCRRETVLTALLMVLAVLSAVAFPFTQYTENSILLIWYLPVFIAGMLLALLYHRFGERVPQSGIFDAAAFFGAAGILLLTPAARAWLWNIEPSGWLQNKYLLIGGLWTLILTGALYGRWLKPRLSGCRILKCIGKYSYELYLVHYIILWELSMLVENIWLRGLLMLLLSAVLAGLLHWLSQRIQEICRKIW